MHTIIGYYTASNSLSVVIFLRASVRHAASRSDRSYAGRRVCDLEPVLAITPHWTHAYATMHPLAGLVNKWQVRSTQPLASKLCPDFMRVCDQTPHFIKRVDAHLRRFIDSNMYLMARVRIFARRSVKR